MTFCLILSPGPEMRKVLIEPISVSLGDYHNFLEFRANAFKSDVRLYRPQTGPGPVVRTAAVVPVGGFVAAETLRPQAFVEKPADLLHAQAPDPAAVDPAV